MITKVSVGEREVHSAVHRKLIVLVDNLHSLAYGVGYGLLATSKECTQILNNPLDNLLGLRCVVLRLVE